MSEIRKPDFSVEYHWVEQKLLCLNCGQSSTVNRTLVFAPPGAMEAEKMLNDCQACGMAGLNDLLKRLARYEERESEANWIQAMKEFGNSVS